MLHQSCCLTVRNHNYVRRCLLSLVLYRDCPCISAVSLNHIEWVGVPILLLLVPVIVLAPVADEIIGKVQFDRLCDEASEVKVFSTLPAGQELYFPDGRWRLGGSPPPNAAEHRRIESLLAVLRYESTGEQIAGTIIPIKKSEHRVYDRRTGQLLASYLSYHTRGGWLNRWGSENPAIVRPQCFPDGDPAQRIMPFTPGK